MDAFSLPPIGAQHPVIRRFRHVLDGVGPDRSVFFLAEGLWAHQVLLDLGARVEQFLWCPESGYSDEVRGVAEGVAGRADEAYRISERLLGRLSERDRPDGMLSLVRLPSWQPGDLTFGADATVLVADAIEIPGNLGTLLRTLDACDADCLVVTDRRARLSHPKVFRGSRGMNLRVPVIEFDRPRQAARWLRDNGFQIYLATVTEAAKPYCETEFGRRSAIVVGNERHGIGPDWLEPDFARVTIPMLGRADSLNVAVSASILLYAATTARPGPAAPAVPVSPVSPVGPEHARPIQHARAHCVGRRVYAGDPGVVSAVDPGVNPAVSPTAD